MQPKSVQGTELRLAALDCLAETDFARKVSRVQGLAQEWGLGRLEIDRHAKLVTTYAIPGRPERPVLVAPRLVQRRSVTTPEGRAILVHALAHIEFNAINLALDAVWRFDGMPREYYGDWLQVADEEARHFLLLVTHLGRMGYCYGDFPAHNSLWEMAARTQHDILARIALIPRTMEARGLDATPLLRAKLAQAGDMEVAAILDTILHDEIGHVAIGNRWFTLICRQRALDPITTYARLAHEFGAPVARGPFNLAARRAAGFSEAELDALG